MGSDMFIARVLSDTVCEPAAAEFAEYAGVNAEWGIWPDDFGMDDALVEFHGFARYFEAIRAHLAKGGADALPSDLREQLEVFRGDYSRAKPDSLNRWQYIALYSAVVHELDPENVVSVPLRRIVTQLVTIHPDAGPARRRSLSQQDLPDACVI